MRVPWDVAHAVQCCSIFVRFRIWQSVDFHALTGPGDKDPKSPRVQGEKGAKVQDERVQVCAPRPTWQQDPGEKPSKRAKDNTDGKAGEGPW